MKKNKLLILLAIIVAFSSCSKQNEAVVADKTEKLYNVKLSVSTFSTEIVPLSSAKLSSTSSSTAGTTATNAVTVGDQINYLEYVIYNSTGVMVKNATQVKSLASFGTISEQLTSGDYKVFVVGSTEQFSILSKESKTSIFLTPSNNKIGDYFTKSLDLKVTEESQSQNVVLDRVVGKLEIQISDAIPTTATKISLSSTSGSWVNLNSSFDPSSVIKTVETTLSSTDKGKTDFVVSQFIIPLQIGSITSDVSIRAYNADGGLIADKIVKNVKVEKNKKTILTGKVFTGTTTTPTSGFAIQVNSDWNTETNNVSF